MASYTSNLNLVKYDIGDKVTPSGYNDNFTKIDNAITDLKVDYIVAQGIQNASNGNLPSITWTYRKWASGIAECWGEASSTTYGIDQAWSGWNYNRLERRNYPITFIEPPVETISHNLTDASGKNPRSSIVGCLYPPTTTQTAVYEVYRSDQVNSVVSHMKYHAIGRWK